MVVNPNIDSFESDVCRNGGYQYTTNARLSSQFANERLTEVSLALAPLQGKKILDIGCGDGAYTVELCDRANPEFMIGIDPAPTAIDVASCRAGVRKINFRVGSAYDLPFADQSFDWAYLRGVLHHMDRPETALGEAMRVAERILVIEPNGYNPVLKLLERFSRYHIEHDEKSFTSRQLTIWVKKQGGRIVQSTRAGVVPMFCPNWFARVMKSCEPILERIPVLSLLGCAVFVFVAENKNIRSMRGAAA